MDIIGNPIPQYMDKNRAQATAQACAASDPEWTYKVEPRGNWYVVAVYDERGESMGAL